MKMFVPGRLCLFGEHSDWAGGYRTINPALHKGYTLSVGTNQGIYAQVKPHPTHLILHSCLTDGTRKELLQIPMDREQLLAEAKKGGFFSYAAGVAYQALTLYQVQGVEIDNYQTDLPIQKGLASSAAISVLVARSFNQLYQLKLTLRGEMELAYHGEITTPSRCGRLDQSCAYGNRPVMMVFDGQHINIIELKTSQHLFFVMVDLSASKNTHEILSILNQCYPFATNEIKQSVHKYLGQISAKMTQEAATALEQGDAESLGALMTQAQIEFDRYLIRACPSQLTAPVLHSLLKHPPLQSLILGGKGVGSQGDGTAQFIVKNSENQQRVIELIKRDFPQMQCLKLVISPSSPDVIT